MAKSYREQNQVIANLGMHGQRLARWFKAWRRNLEKEQRNNAESIMKMHQDEGLPYDPARDGFVFSPAEIETCIQRNVRIEQARRADFHRPCPPPPLTLSGIT